MGGLVGFGCQGGDATVVACRWCSAMGDLAAGLSGVVMLSSSQGMEVHFTPDVQAKPDQMARDTGRPSGELLEDAVAGLFDELAYTREMLDRRYDDLESGRVQRIDGAETYRRLMEKTAAQRRQRRLQ